MKIISLILLLFSISSLANDRPVRWQVTDALEKCDFETASRLIDENNIDVNGYGKDNKYSHFAMDIAQYGYEVKCAVDVWKFLFSKGMRKEKFLKVFIDDPRPSNPLDYTYNNADVYRFLVVEHGYNGKDSTQDIYGKNQILREAEKSAAFEVLDVMVELGFIEISCKTAESWTREDFEWYGGFEWLESYGIDFKKECPPPIWGH